MRLTSFLHTYQFPAKSEPAWGSHVERWTQLDAASFGLAETFFQFRERLRARPTTVFLASPTASNTTDRHFVATGARSPAKFVHTLPNIRSAVLLKLAQTEGPMYCLQRDPHTVGTAIAEAADFLRGGSPGPVWIASVFESTSQAWLGILTTDDGPWTLEFNPRPAPKPATDQEILEWLPNDDAPRLALAPHWEIVKSSNNSSHRLETRGSF